MWELSHGIIIVKFKRWVEIAEMAVNEIPREAKIFEARCPATTDEPELIRLFPLQVVGTQWKVGEG